MALVLLDANLLIYSFDGQAPQHPAARQWLETMLLGDNVVGVPMLAISALLRTATHPSLDYLPERLEDALGFIDDLLAMPNVRVVHTDGKHLQELKRTLEESGVMGRSITDAEFAALALSHGATFYSTDKHFRRFPRLRWVNPLATTER